MKSRFLTLAAALALPFTGAVKGADDKMVLPAGGQAKPRLEVPFGTEVLVEAKIARAEDAGCGDLAGQYVLEVSRVSGKELARKQVFQFRAEKELAKRLSNDVFELYRMKSGKIVDEISPEQIEAVEKGYVGLNLQLMASELSPQAQGGKAKVPTLLLSKCLKGL